MVSEWQPSDKPGPFLPYKVPRPTGRTFVIDRKSGRTLDISDLVKIAVVVAMMPAAAHAADADLYCYVAQEFVRRQASMPKPEECFYVQQKNDGTWAVELNAVFRDHHTRYLVVFSKEGRSFVQQGVYDLGW